MTVYHQFTTIISLFKLFRVTFNLQLFTIFYRQKQKAVATFGLFLTICFSIMLAVAFFLRYQISFIATVPFRPHNQQVIIGKSHVGLIVTLDF